MHDFFYKHAVNGKRVARRMTLSLFQDVLVNNSDTRFKNNYAQYPKREFKNGIND